MEIISQIFDYVLYAAALYSAMQILYVALMVAAVVIIVKALSRV